MALSLSLSLSLSISLLLPPLRGSPYMGQLGLRSVFTPRISIGPAGYRINRDYARRGWATETGNPKFAILASPALRGVPQRCVGRARSALPSGAVREAWCLGARAMTGGGAESAPHPHPAREPCKKLGTPHDFGTEYSRLLTVICTTARPAVKPAARPRRRCLDAARRG